MILRMLPSASSVGFGILERATYEMFFPRLGISSIKDTQQNAVKSPVLAIIALITIGGSMCFVAGGLFLFSAISSQQSEKYCSGFLIIFIGIVLLMTCYFAWVLTSHRFTNWMSESTSESNSQSAANDVHDGSPPSYDEVVREM
ncbi:unnamed protein product [Hermetia illucens]|uniref:Uncharacterized protein n=2 Tax=Hermetia illucens TaxID=343691 RepID=A0A7R8UCD4_HERIL|nr:unnamed protein product [Hermetia illucens]